MPSKKLNLEALLRQILLWFLIIFLLTATVHSTIAPGNKSKQLKQIKTFRGPQNETVFQRKLVEEEPSAKDIIMYQATYHKETSLRNFNGTVLGYVTAWNSHGYDVAKIFAKKFDIISPVWLQIIKVSDQYELVGTHDVDSGWMKDIRWKGKQLQIFPRVIFDKLTEHEYALILGHAQERTLISNLIIKACKQYGFDGIVLEFWSQLAGHVDDKFLYAIVREISDALESQNLRLILVIPPLKEEIPMLFGEQQMDKLYEYVYAFSLMTYDYSSLWRPGANAPLYWIRKTIEHIVPPNSPNAELKRRKILMGLNMYGNDYTPDGGGAIVAGQYLELLKHVKKRLAYDEHDVENYFEVKTSTGRHTVFYPTLFSIHERIKLAQEMGVGLSIWELGQGLDYFYDLF